MARKAQVKAKAKPKGKTKMAKETKAYDDADDAVNETAEDAKYGGEAKPAKPAKKTKDQVAEENETYIDGRQWAIEQAIANASGQGFNTVQLLELAEGIWGFTQPKPEVTPTP